VSGLGHAARSAVGIIGPTIGGYVLATYGTRGVGATSACILALALAFLRLSRGSLMGLEQSEQHGYQTRSKSRKGEGARTKEEEGGGGGGVRGKELVSPRAKTKDSKDL
jgi:hypothetical protein